MTGSVTTVMKRPAGNARFAPRWNVPSSFFRMGSELFHSAGMILKKHSVSPFAQRCCWLLSAVIWTGSSLGLSTLRR